MPEGGSSSDQAEVTSESTVGVGAKRKERPAEELTPVPEEMSLPVAAIMRIIKAKLPDGVQIGKEAKTAFSKACSIFIMYVTTIANDLAKESKRSTVTAADVLHALKELEFDDFLPMVENSLFAYRENDKAKALEAAAKRAARTGDEGASAFDAGDAKDDDGGYNLPADPSALPGNRTLKITFNTDVDGELPWSFKPVQNHVSVLAGQTCLAFFEATNHSTEPIIGVATYNVAPMKAGAYFNKIQCFCFDEQRLLPGETVDMPVFFYVDPDFLDDRSLRSCSTLTLSYTFFRSSDVDL